MAFRPHFSNAATLVASNQPTESPQPIVVAIQGGSALVSFAWGVLDVLLDQRHLHILGATGTSAGAITAAYLIEGLVKGDSDYARERLSTCWYGLSRFQKSQMPLWFDPFDTAVRLAYINPLFASFYRAGTQMVQAINAKFEKSSKPYLKHSAILDYLEKTEAGRSLDFDAINTALSPFLVMNSVAAAPNANLWTLPCDSERIHSTAVFLPDAYPITPAGMAGGGSPGGMVPAVEFEGEWHSDGAYCANPHLGDGLLDYCEQEQAVLVIIRSRPPSTSHEVGSSNDFNLVLDRQLAALESTRPHLKKCVIAPPYIIADPASSFAAVPELDFGQIAIECRHAAGRLVASDVVTRHPLLTKSQLERKTNTVPLVPSLTQRSLPSAEPIVPLLARQAAVPA